MSEEVSAGLWTRSHKLIKFDVPGDIRVPEETNVAQSLMGIDVILRYYEGFGIT